MVLDNNDEDWFDEAEEVDEAVDLEGTEFPLRLGKNLQGTFICSPRGHIGSLTGQIARYLRPSGQMRNGACLFSVLSTEAGENDLTKAVAATRIYGSPGFMEGYLCACSDEAGPHRVDAAHIPHQEAHLPSGLLGCEGGGAFCHAQGLCRVPL
jgi:hypothetical protein